MSQRGRLAEKEIKRQLWLQDGRACHYCRKEISLDQATRDHVVPKAFGGTMHRWNLVISCAGCNGGLQDAVQKCDCAKCRRAVIRFHQRIKPGRPASVRPVVTVTVPANLVELEAELVRRCNNLSVALDRLDNQDSHQAAAGRGKLRGYREALDLVRHTEDGRSRIRQAAS